MSKLGFWRKIKNTYSSFTRVMPISARAWILLITATASLYLYGIKSSDLIAGVLGASILGFIAVLLICFLTALPSLSKMKPQIAKSFLVETQDTIESGTTTQLPFVLSHFKQPALTRIKLCRIFSEPSVECTPHFFSGNSSKHHIQKILDPVIFPHRGVFRQTHVEVLLSDILGLFKRVSLVPAEKYFEVHPPKIDISPLPIVASSSVLGDTEQSQLERTGDLFDIKPYQSGDSLKRIIWKAYARSGELFVRHPEPAIAPEGNISIYVAAKAQQDDVAAASLSYLRLLDQQNVDYSIGFYGKPNALCHSYLEAETTCIQAATSQSSNHDFSSYVEKLLTVRGASRNIIVFCSEDDLHPRGGLHAILDTGIREGIQLVFALTPTSRPNKNDKVSHLLDRMTKNKTTEHRTLSLHPYESHNVQYKRTA